MIEKSFGGKIPKPGPRLPQDEALAKAVSETIGEALDRFEKFEFARSLEAIWAAIASADKYLTSEQPWHSAIPKPTRSARPQFFGRRRNCCAS